MNSYFQQSVSANPLNANALLFGKVDSKHDAASSNDAVHTSYENVIEFENWTRIALQAADSTDFICSKVGPSRTAIWRQLYWISKQWTNGHDAFLLREKAEYEYIMLLVADTPSKQHDAIDRAQLICSEVFGNYYEAVFNRARTFIGPRNPITDWPELMAA
ncbi:MAG: hypothetical protein ACRDAM_15350 [Casimicrobium sp.]